MISYKIRISWGKSNIFQQLIVKKRPKTFRSNLQSSPRSQCCCTTPNVYLQWISKFWRTHLSWLTENWNEKNRMMILKPTSWAKYTHCSAPSIGCFNATKKLFQSSEICDTSVSYSIELQVDKQLQIKLSSPALKAVFVSNSINASA